MSELPREARALLALAKDAHDPIDPEARERVRRGVASALAAGAGLAIAGKASAGMVAAGQAGAHGAVAGHAALAGQAAVAGKTGLFASLGAKVATLTAVAVVAGSAATLIPMRKEAPRQSKTHVAAVHRSSVVAPSNEQVAAPSEQTDAVALEGVETAPAPSVQAQAHAAANAAIHPMKHAKHADAHRNKAQQAPSADALRNETALLGRASDALAANDPRRALSLLKEHEQSFARPMLGEERDGLRVLAQCMLTPQASRARAKAFLAHAPSTVLAGRIARACKLTEQVR